MAILKRLQFTVLTAVLYVTTVVAQPAGDHPNQVNGPADKVEPGLLETPFLWIGLVVFGLGLLLLFLRKGKTATTNRLHKY